MFILSEHVYIAVNMKPCLPGTDAEHHACSKDSRTHVNLPVESTTIEDPCTSHSSCTIRPVGMKVSDLLLVSVKANLAYPYIKMMY